MNYDKHDITTSRVNPYDRHDEEEFSEAEERAESTLKEVVNTAEKEESDCQETALQMLENIKHIKFYGNTGGFTICLEEDTEDFSFYLIHGEKPKTVDFEKNQVGF